MVGYTLRRAARQGLDGPETMLHWARSDLTENFDWARSDLTGNFDWARSDLTGRGRYHRMGDEDDRDDHK